MVNKEVLHDKNDRKENSNNDKDGLINLITHILDIECAKTSLVNATISLDLVSTNTSLAKCGHEDINLGVDNEPNTQNQDFKEKLEKN